MRTRYRVTTGQIREPWSRKKRITVIVGGCIGAIAIFGTIADANTSSQERQYKTCLEAYHDTKYCYDDVWHGGSKAPTSPSSTPSKPTTKVPVPVTLKGFHFCDACPLDTTQVIDLR